MEKWYAIKRLSDSVIVSYTTDLEIEYGNLPVGYQYVGPYNTHDQAMRELEAIKKTKSEQMIEDLSLKPSNTWNLGDIADWLKAKG